MPIVRRYGKSDGEAAYETHSWTHGRVVHAYIARACIVNLADAATVCAEQLMRLGRMENANNRPLLFTKFAVGAHVQSSCLAA